MSDYISGSLGQSVSQDYGEFVTVGEFRLRKDLITIYAPNLMKDDPEGRQFGILITVYGERYGLPIGTREETEIELQKLDWIFKKAQRT